MTEGMVEGISQGHDGIGFVPHPVHVKNCGVLRVERSDGGMG